MDESHASIAEIRADGVGVKAVLDGLESRGNHLADVATAIFTGSLDQLDQLELDGIDRVVASVDTWTAWAHGRPVASTNLAAAVETLTEHAWHSPLFVASPGVGRDQWMELLSPVTQLLLDHGMDIHSKPGLVVEPAGLELDSTSDHWVNSSDCCGRVAVIFDQRRPAGIASTPPPFGALWS